VTKKYQNREHGSIGSVSCAAVGGLCVGERRISIGSDEPPLRLLKAREGGESGGVQAGQGEARG